MAPTTRTLRMWQIRLAGAGLLLLALLTGLAGPTSAYARDFDDDRDDNEVVTTGPNVCTATANLPLYPNATCIQHETEQDDGVTETKNTYVTSDAADTVRQAYEAAFGQNGWTLVASEHDMADQEWEYRITRGAQRVEVDIEVRNSAAGPGTEIDVKEW
jgi:hypothetical protein